MFKKLLILTAAVLIGSTAQASDYIYKSKNKIDFIKIDDAKKEEKKDGLKHPYTFDAQQIRDILGSLKFNKKIVGFEDISDRSLFDEGNVEFLAPYLIQAFEKATPEQAVVVSFFTRSSKVVIQDDRLTVFRAFIKDDGLHFKFNKVYAKLLGDRTTAGADRVAANARSMRVSLEPQSGQNRISWDPEEIVFDLTHFAAGGVKLTDKVVAKEETKESKKIVNATKTSKAAPAATSIKDRLKELDQLKKDELITEQEYQKKRKDLIKEL